MGSGYPSLSSCCRKPPHLRETTTSLWTDLKGGTGRICKLRSFSQETRPKKVEVVLVDLLLTPEVFIYSLKPKKLTLFFLRRFVTEWTEWSLRVRTCIRTNFRTLKSLPRNWEWGVNATTGNLTSRWVTSRETSPSEVPLRRPLWVSHGRSLSVEMTLRWPKHLTVCCKVIYRLRKRKSNIFFIDKLHFLNILSHFSFFLWRVPGRGPL